MRRLLILVVAFFASICLSAQELDIISNSKGKMGANDKQGKEIIPCKMDEIIKWGKGLYKVKLGKTYGLYDSKGNQVLPTSYSNISALNCWDRALITIGGKIAKGENSKQYIAKGKYGIINGDGTIIIPAEYVGLYEYSYDGSKAKIYTEGKRLGYDYHYINDTLKTDCRYVGFGNSGDNCYLCGIIDGVSGKVLVPSGLYTFLMEPQNDMARYYKWDKRKTTYGYHDIQNNKSIEVATFDGTGEDITFWTHGDFTGNIAPVYSQTWKFVDREGKTLRSGYNKVTYSQYANVWFAQKSDNTADFFDNNNADITYLKNYKSIRFPKDNCDKIVFPVQNSSDKWGVIDNTGKVLIKFEYELAGSPSFDMIPMKQNSKWGCANADGKILVPCQFEDFKLPTRKNPTNFFVKKEDKLFYNYDLGLKKITSIGYQNASPFEDGLAWVHPVDLTVPNNNLNRGLMNSNEESFQEHTKEFGYIINTKNETMFPELVNYYYVPNARNRILKEGRALTKGQAMQELLDYSKNYRQYNITEKITEENWDY